MTKRIDVADPTPSEKRVRFLRLAEQQALLQLQEVERALARELLKQERERERGAA
jgi:hypothetical protein